MRERSTSETEKECAQGEPNSVLVGVVTLNKIHDLRQWDVIDGPRLSTINYGKCILYYYTVKAFVVQVVTRRTRFTAGIL